MKLVVNYDFFKKIKLLNNPESKLTLVKIRTNLWIKEALPLSSIFIFALTYPNMFKCLNFITLYYLAYSIGSDLYIKKYKRDNITSSTLKAYKKDIISLASNFNKLNINTDYDSLLNTELYHKETKVVLNNHLPCIMQKKYYNIPTYSITGDIKPVSIEEEHIIGSKKYVLTLGSPKTVHSFAYSSI